MRLGAGGQRRRAETAAWWPRVTVGRRARARRGHLFRPAALPLEDRRLLSTFDVTSTADDGSTGTLRWAVAQANTATSASTIDFKLGTTPATITLTQGQLELSNTAAAITIDGPGASLLSVSGNNASRVFQVDPSVTASISDLTVTGGSSAFAGGLYNAGSATLGGCTIAGNSAESGGGLGNVGTISLTGCTISGNSGASATSAHHGVESGGLYTGGTATLTDCTITGNSAGDVGGMAVGAGTVRLSDCTISDNSGGGLLSAVGRAGGSATLTDCTISDNPGVGLGTGHAYFSYVPTISATDCTISGNSAGGVSNGYRASVTLTACTISGNSATKGGGVFNFGPIHLTACTISGNSATTGGGLYDVLSAGYSSPATLIDTIVAGNAGGGGVASDVVGPGAGAVTGTNNLIGTGGSGGITGGSDGNIVLTSLAGLGLAPLGNYGGPTQTMGLQPGSPAIGAGISVSGVTTDQRGDPLETPPDIGAFQGTVAAASLSFSGLASPAITYGTASVTLSGTLAGDGQFPQGKSVSVTLNGVSQQATVGAGGAFTSAFHTSTLGVSGSPYTVSYSYAGDATYGPVSSTSRLTVTPAAPKVAVTDAGGAFTGEAFPGVATITGVGGTASSGLEGVTPMLSYYPGTSAAGTPLPGPPSQPGTYTVVAAFPGSADYGPARTAATFAIQPAAPSVAVSVSSTSITFGQPLTVVATVSGPGPGIAYGGTVTFYSYFNYYDHLNGGAPLDTVAVGASGKAVLTTSTWDGLGAYPIVAHYNGDADLTPATATSAEITFSPAVARATVLPPRPVFRGKRQLVSVTLSIDLRSTVPGAGLPSGVVDFDLAPRKKHGKPIPVRPKILGQAVLQDGTATVSLPARQVLNKTLSVFYGGMGFQDVSVTLPRLTLRMLRGLARSIGGASFP